MSKAIVVRTHESVTSQVHAPVLTKNEKKVLAEALRLGEEAGDAIEDALVSYGRWILINVFDDDAASALETKRANAVWHELVRRAGGPTLRLSRKLLYVSVQIAAHDKRITDEAWRKLEPGRKEILLPLADERAMRKAAQHVMAMKLTHRATRAYVKALRDGQSGPRAVRLTAKTVVARVRSFREVFADESVTRRIAEVFASAKPVERQQALRELRALERWVTKVREQLQN